MTTLSRCCDSATHSPAQLSATIEWPLAQPSSPKQKSPKEPVATVSLDGRTEPSDVLLKKSIMGKSVTVLFFFFFFINIY